MNGILSTRTLASPLCEVGMIEGHMRCPVCGHPESKVVDSRPSDEFNSIRRRRECLKCGNRFTTYERLGDNPIIVVEIRWHDASL